MKSGWCFAGMPNSLRRSKNYGNMQVGGTLGTEQMKNRWIES